MNDKTLIKDVSDTAFMVAAYRAIETERPDALFRDPLAKKLSGEHGERIVRDMNQVFFGGSTVVIRTCIIDDFIQTCISRGVDTIVNLGAGLDTRPYRMNLPKTLKWIEVDYPRVIELKEKTLSDQTPRCQLERVSLDLANHPLRRELFAKIQSESKSCLVLTEGVVPYLSVEETATLADDLASLSVYKYWIVDYFSSRAMKYRMKKLVKTKMKHAPFLFDPPDYFGFFKRHGWVVDDIRYISDEAKRLNRPMQFPLYFKVLVGLCRLLLTKNQFSKLDKYAAYVIFKSVE